MTTMLVAALAAFLMAAQLFSCLVAWMRCGLGMRTSAPAEARPPLTIVRPLCGIETFSRECLAAAFRVRYPRFELLFCVANEDDPVIPMVRDAIAAHPDVAARLLIGNDPISINPKLNNMVKGWREAAHPWIAFIDSNVLITPDFVDGAMATWRDTTGLVTAPPVGTRPEGFGGHLECAFLNTHEARWQYFVDTFGFGFAQGKTLLYRKSHLDRSKMLELASEPAEDAASTKMVRALGLKVRLAPPSPQPLGRRAVAAVWGRQLRWARLRRTTFVGAFLPEIVGGAVPPTAMVAVAAWLDAVPVLPVASGYLVLWYAAELLLARACRWPIAWQTLPCSLLRDLMMPVLWIGAFTGRSFTWQGNAMRMEERPSRKPTAARPRFGSG